MLQDDLLESYTKTFYTTSVPCPYGFVPVKSPCLHDTSCAIILSIAENGGERKESQLASPHMR